jgi:indole-3-glycerol phosphate synthase
MSRLDELFDSAREGVRRRRAQRPLSELAASAARGQREQRPFKEAVQRPGLSVVAEFKRGSPSAGAINAGADVAATVAAYERGGASALSILTDERNFHGSLADLVSARDASSLPILRKDFTFDEYQLFEAIEAGADAVLLIAAGLDDRDLAGLFERATELDLDCLVEVHTPEDLERALELDPDLIGINNRNLRDLTVDTERARELITDVPAGKAVVAESGYSSREDMVGLSELGVDAVLIGEALMRAPDPEETLRDLIVDEDVTSEHRIAP